MSTVQSTASPLSSRGKQAHTNAGRQSQPRSRGNRAHNGHNQYNGSNASPSRRPRDYDPASTDSAGFCSEDAQFSSAPRRPKKQTQSQPAVDPASSLTDTEPAANNPSATPIKIQGAYAGPTFHASPAPSALPIPKFLSRSVPAKTRSGPPTPPPEDSSDSNNSPSPPIASPSRVPFANPLRHQDSPLDLLFNADKAERAKNLHGSPVSANFFNSPGATRPPHDKHDSFTSLNGIFPIELDSKSKDAPISTLPAAASLPNRAATEPCKVPQLKDGSSSANGNEVMQDLFNRLSMSQKNIKAATPPKMNGQTPSEPQSRHQTPSPFHDGRTPFRSASGPSTPAPTNQDSLDYFYGNRNLSPLFQAAKGDTAKRNSGLRTEITADSPLVAQGMFQDFPSIPPPRMMNSANYSRGYSGAGNEGPAGPRRGSVPIIQSHQQSPNNRRRTPGRQAYQPRPDSYPARINPNCPAPRAGRGAGNGSTVPAAKPSTTAMSFVPSSVAAKQHSTSTPPSTESSFPVASNPTPSDTLSLEQDLKRLLNLKTSGDMPSVR